VVLDSVAANQTRLLAKELVGTVTNNEQILVSRVPADGSDLLSTALIIGETPEWQY